MASLYREVTERLKNEGCSFVRAGKGSHEGTRFSPISGRTFTVPRSLASMPLANAILKQAGLPEIPDNGSLSRTSLTRPLKNTKPRMTSMIKLMIVDDSALMRKHLVKLFEQEGDFTIRTARTGAEALVELPTFSARCDQSGHQHAGNGRHDRPEPDHDRTPVSGGHGVLTDRKRRAGDSLQD